MKVIPIGTNHIRLELECGVILDVNDGTLKPFIDKGTTDGVVLIESLYELHRKVMLLPETSLTKGTTLRIHLEAFDR